MGAVAAHHEVLLGAVDVDALPWGASRHDPRIEDKLLWRDPNTASSAGLMRLRPGASLARHTHRYAVHHGWVMRGSCVVDGKELPEGSYWFIPAGTEHGIARAGREGCTVFYLYLRAEMDD